MLIPILAMLAGCLALASDPARAHLLAPSLLELREGEGDVVEVSWKTSLYQPRGSRLEPLLPESCRPLGEARSSRQGTGWLTRWEVRCASTELTGLRLGVKGLAESHTNAIVRVVRRDGEAVQALLDGGRPLFEIPFRSTPIRTFASYLHLGVKHLWMGFDHVLFVLGLLLLIRDRRRLLVAISTFTLGHSLTLSLATLGYADVPTGLIEVGIAGSLLLLALEIPGQRDAEASLLERRPWTVTAVFGLLHGLGFAGALAEIGLPKSEIPLALLAFNLGIELGQIALILLAGALTLAWRRSGLPFHGNRSRWLAAYAMGALAAFWVLERATAAMLTSL